MNYNLSEKYIKVNMTNNEKNKLLKKIIKHMIKNKTESKVLSVYVIIGHPGSSKSQFTKIIKNNNYITIDPDKIKLFMPDYLKNIHIDGKNITSKHIGYNAILYKWFVKQILDYFIKLQKYNLIIESVCAYPIYCCNIIDKLYNNNYKINIYGFHINDLNLVKTRIHNRFKKTGRYIDDNYIEDAHKQNINNINVIFHKMKDKLNSYYIHVT